jgi:Fic family protein
MTAAVIDPLLMRRIEAEFREMPGLVLTAAQAQRLWGLEATACDAVLAHLTARGVLARTKAGAYMLARDDRG